MAVAPDGSWLAAADSNPLGRDGGEVRIWDPHTGKVRDTLTGHTRGVSVVAVAPDGSWLASADGGYGGGEVRIWDPHTGQLRHNLTGHTRGVTALAVAPDGSWLASASHDATARIWSTAGRYCAASLRTGQPLSAVVTDGRRVAVAGDRGLYLLTLTPPPTSDHGVGPR